MKDYGLVALRAVADSLDSLVDMEVYFAVLDDSMLAVGQEIYHLMFDNTDDLLLASIDEKMLWKCIEMLCKIRKIEWNTPPSEGGVIFCDGNIAAKVENGNLLKMLLRLDDLLKKQKVRHE